MKAKHLLLLILILLTANIYAQEDEAEEKEKVTISERQYDELKKTAKKYDSISKKNDSQSVGYLKAYKFEVPLRYYTGGGITINTATYIKIDSISISAKDGYITDINVYSKGKQFSNKSAPISLTVKRFSKSDYLYNTFNIRESIVLKDILEIVPKSSFIPDDFFVKLTPEKNSIELKRNVGINTVFDLRLYTDALALFGNEANGLVQINGNFKHIIHRYNYRNTEIFTPFHYLRLDFNASKFDSINKYVYTDNFSTSSIVQKSHFSVEGSVNMVSGWLINKSLSSFFVDLGGGVSSTKMVEGTNEKAITFSNIYIEGGVKIKSSDNIGGDFSCRLSKLFSPQTEHLIQETPTTFFNFIRIKTEVYWSPFAEKASRLFARFNYFTNTNSFDKPNHFYQVQIGYSLLISDLIK